MKPTFALLLAACLPLLAVAEDALPLDKTQEIARKATEQLGAVTDAPFTVTPDCERPQAMPNNGSGFMVIPDQALSAEKLASLGTETVPVGQLWLLNTAVAEGEASPSKERLREVLFDDNGVRTAVQMYLLGAGKDSEGKPELRVLGKGPETLAHFPLEAVNLSTTSLPLELLPQNDTGGSGILTVTILGLYTAIVRLAPLP